MGEVPPVDTSIPVPEPTPQDIPPPESDDEDLDFGGPPSVAR